MKIVNKIIKGMGAGSLQNGVAWGGGGGGDIVYGNFTLATAPKKLLLLNCRHSFLKKITQVAKNPRTFLYLKSRISNMYISRAIKFIVDNCISIFN